MHVCVIILLKPSDEEAYTSYYTEEDYPVAKILRQPVHVEIRVLGRTDPNLVLQIGNCWATSSPSPLSLPQWDLLVNGYLNQNLPCCWLLACVCVSICGASSLKSIKAAVASFWHAFSRCPSDEDRYLTTLLPVTGLSSHQYPTHYKRFVVQMFTFVDKDSLLPLQEQVLHGVHFVSLSATDVACLHSLLCPSLGVHPLQHSSVLSLCHGLMWTEMQQAKWVVFPRSVAMSYWGLGYFSHWLHEFYAYNVI